MKEHAMRWQHCVISFGLVVTGLPAGAQAQGDWATRLCAGRAACSAAATTDAGRDRDGRQLKVVELAIKRETNDAGLRCRPHIREFWVVAGEGAAAQPRKLMTLCNDGYGAAGVGEDTIVVKPNRIVYDQMGGSNWRWLVTRNIQLSPMRVLSESHCSYWNGGPGFSIDRWSWTRFSGRTILRFQPKNANEKDEIGCEPQSATHQYLSLPALVDEEGKLPTGPIAVGSCGIVIRDDGSAGYMVYGKPGPAGGAEARVVLVGKRELLVTVEVARLEAGRTWVDSDHIEIWQGGLMSIGTEYLTSDPLVQYGIRLTDGRVFAAYGRPKALPEVLARKSERLANGRTRIALRLRLPREVHAVTVVLSKAVAGTQSRMVATSPVQYGKAATLGGTFTVSNRAARCAVRSGRLEIVESGSIKMLEQ